MLLNVNMNKLRDRDNKPAKYELAEREGDKDLNEEPEPPLEMSLNSPKSVDSQDQPTGLWASKRRRCEPDGKPAKGTVTFWGR